MSCTCKYGSGRVCGFCEHRAQVNARLKKLEAQESDGYARGVAEGERRATARVVAWLVKSADRTSDDKTGPVKIVLLNSAVAIERGEHEEGT